MISIRPERPEDAAVVRRINELAFGQPSEASLVERLRQTCPDALSLVAEDAGLVGHILFTPVAVESVGTTSRRDGIGPDRREVPFK